ncbi:hypothetical protein [Lactobacillus gigeriorum]|uniref:Uncharacterized protein n=1 Tax=Lactobacillus gigeriorum DSM 23908 = CRBIP 24.85 TaxID=1423751 RepID=I7KNJ6_9LACO|nr:hypothetical protein [Lactobacillus gigeriorum]KRN07972.1 hypothetical protein FC38_GL000309 [Lactobacillus gigeriorum DSM 23908 = CRBIP 24.85]CCI86779.1 Putative uncharacterized protein [Lactobacillus gigeriorum DSM 23908 = CRBIP 24.85]
MNNENVFFNPGDAIASSHDHKKVRRSRQIFKAAKPTAGKLVIDKANKNSTRPVYFAGKTTNK